jgi:hypothetical protein
MGLRETGAPFLFDRNFGATAYSFEEVTKPDYEQFLNGFANKVYVVCNIQRETLHD